MRVHGILKRLILAALILLPVGVLADSFVAPGPVSVDNPQYGTHGTVYGGVPRLSVTLNGTNTGTISGGPGAFVAGEHVVLHAAGALSSLSTPTVPGLQIVTTLGTDMGGTYHTTQMEGGIMNPGCFVDSSGSLSAWQATHSYVQDDMIKATANGLQYIMLVKTGGTSGGSEPSWGTATFAGSPIFPSTPTAWGAAWHPNLTINDNTVVWSPAGLVGHGTNSNCTTSYTYKLVAIDANNGHSAASPTASITGPATLSPTNAIKVQITGLSGARAWDICGCTGGGCTPSSLWAILPQRSNNGGSFYYLDIGNHFGNDEVNGTTCTSSATAEDVLTTISSISSTSVVFAATPSASATVTMYPDDEPGFASALTDAQAQKPVAKLVLGAGKTYSFGQSWDLSNVSNQLIDGQGANIVWHGPLGGSMITAGTGLANSTLTGIQLNVLTSAGQYAGVGVDIDQTGALTTRDTFDRMSFDSMSDGIRFSNTGTANVENMTVTNSLWGRGTGSSWDKMYHAIENGNDTQADGWYLNNNVFGYAGTDAIFAYCALGSAVLENFRFSNNYNFLYRTSQEMSCTAALKRIDVRELYAEGLNRLLYDDIGTANSTITFTDSYVNPTPPGDSYVIDTGAQVFINKLRLGNSASTPAKFLHTSTTIPMKLCDGTFTEDPNPIFGYAAAPGPFIDTCSDMTNFSEPVQQYSATRFGSSLTAGVVYGNGTPGISGGGSLATGSNSIAGTVTSAAATGNVLTPGFTCPNTVVCILSDETTLGGAKVTASDTTTCTFSATASDTVDYFASCR